MDSTVRARWATVALADDGVRPMPVERAIRDALDGVNGPVVLAVSGGRDSMALMFAMAAWARPRLAAVATFDHGTGAAATEAAALVVAEARRLGLNVVRERARGLASTEAAWREARWTFLRRVAGAFGARIATAHTRDDHLETVVLRLLRGSGARGLAALAAPSPHVRPWLSLARVDVAAWADAAHVPYVEDPTNQSRRYRRARVRHDLLPALEAASPGFSVSMLSIAAAAASWRADVERYVDALVLSRLTTGDDAKALVPAMRRVVQVPVSDLRRTTDDGRAVLWPAAMAKVGVTIDRHALDQLLRFTRTDRLGAEVQLAGGASVRRVYRDGVDLFELHGFPARPMRWRLEKDTAMSASHPATSFDQETLWQCMLPAGGPLTLRAWMPGDRIRTAGAPAGRRVARYLSEARIPSLDRPGWPVVLWESEIVWIPGVCRSVAAPNRPGWSDLIRYRCEREHG